MNIRHRIRNGIGIFQKKGVAAFFNSACSKLSAMYKPDYCFNQPTFAQIEVTTYCNLKCSTCREFVDQLGPEFNAFKHLTLGKFKEILSKLSYLTKVRLNGIGEPLLNPDLFEMVNYAHSKGIHVNFFTNGTMLKKEIVEELLRSEVDLLLFSIDGGYKESFERIRKGAKFDEVINDIKNLVEMKKRLGYRKPNFAVMTTVSKENISEVSQIVELVHSVGIRNLVFKGMIPSFEELEEKVVTGDEIFKHIGEAVEKAKSLAMNLNIGPFARLFSGNSNDRHPECIWPWTSTYITVDGWITPCCNLFDHHKIKFGNIFDEDFSAIWNDKNIQKFRSMLKANKVKICYELCDIYLYK